MIEGLRTDGPPAPVSRRQARWWPWAVAAATVVAVALVAHRLGHEPFDYDEAYAIRFSRVSWPHLFTVDNGNQVLHLALLKAWRALTGSAFGIRALNVAPFAATVPLAAVVARRISGRVTAALTAAIVATHPLLVALAKQARGYPWATFLFTAALAMLVVSVQDRRPVLFRFVPVVLGLALYAHPATGFGAVALLASLWWLPHDDVPGSRVRATAVYGVLAVPFAVVAINAGSAQISWANTGYEPLRAVAVLYYLPGGTRLSALLLVAGIAGAVGAVRDTRRAGHTVAGWTAGVLVAVVAGTAALVCVAAVRQSFFVDRFLAYLVVPLAVLAAQAVERVSWRRVATGAAVLLVVYQATVVVRRDADLRGQPWDRVDRILVDGARPGDALVDVPQSFVVPLEVYHLRDGGGPPDPVVPGVEWGHLPVVSTKDVLRAPPDPSRPLPARVWVVRPDFHDTAWETYLRRVLAGRTLASRTTVGTIVVELWVGR